MIRHHSYEDPLSSSTHGFNFSLAILQLRLWSTTTYLNQFKSPFSLSLSLFSNLECPGLSCKNNQFCLNFIMKCNSQST